MSKSFLDSLQQHGKLRSLAHSILVTAILWGLVAFGVWVYDLSPWYVRLGIAAVFALLLYLAIERNKASKPTDPERNA